VPEGVPLLPTTLVGSYPQPSWLVDREKLRTRLPPRVRAREVWRVPEEQLQDAQDDATIVAIHEQERAGIDILTDGEIRRESYSNHFATALDGIDLDNPGHTLSRSGRPDIVPRVVGPIRRNRPVQVRDTEFLRQHTRRKIKMTVPGPFTMTQQAVDDHYGDEAALAMAYAEAINDEIHDLVLAGADVIQIDEPYLQARVEKARQYAIPAINRALAGVTVPTVLHTCFGYGLIVPGKQTGARYAFLEELTDTAVQQISIEAAQPELDLSVLREMGNKIIMLGVLDLGTEDVESIDTVAKRIGDAITHIDPARLVIAPDCGMKYLSRQAAYGKLSVMVQAAQRVREGLQT
jgi:5-methyltetrahydropteroyltriglutamate--homocysteine methyltransferase